jgi:CheY-like chemotaxis protein
MLNVLLVEDSPSDVELTSMAFEKFSHPNKLHVVEDGEEALNFLFRRGPHYNAVQPDMILLDINIPKQSGQEVLEIIKNDSALKHIPVIILTSSDAPRDISKSYGLRANAYIIKPIDVENYLGVVNEVEAFWMNTARLPKYDA